MPSTSTSEDRETLLAVASGLLRESGAAGFTVHELLGRTGLGTRAFYRHFESKDHLVLAVFAGAARAEAVRLEDRMQAAEDPAAAVVAWIDGRLDLAFDDDVQSDLQFVSREAQALNAAAPDTMAEVHAAMLAPLIRALGDGVASGAFAVLEPIPTALSLDAVTWSCIERQWAAKDQARDDVRRHVLRFCLRAIGAGSGQV
jgi:AcrR family transcriptional regulator